MQKAQEQYALNKTAKGRPIKLGKDFALADFIERKIADEHYSPAAIIMEIQKQGLEFDTTICEKTIYNYVNSIRRRSRGTGRWTMRMDCMGPRSENCPCARGFSGTKTRCPSW